MLMLLPVCCAFMVVFCLALAIAGAASLNPDKKNEIDRFKR